MKRLFLLFLFFTFLLPSCGGSGSSDHASGDTDIDWDNISISEISFQSYTSSGSDLLIHPSAASNAKCIEPEYIAVSSDSRYAYVTLQENNGIAVIDLSTGTIVSVNGLGSKDFGATGNGIDASDRDNAINITEYDNVYGFYMPDAIAAYTYGGSTFLLTANEGDNAWDIFARAGTLSLDSTAFPDATLKTNAKLGRLNVSTLHGINGSGNYERLYAVGARSFSIWNSSISMVYDSKNEFESQIASVVADYTQFNLDNDEPGAEKQSDDGGPDPEGITTGKVGSKVYAFIGLEKQSGIMVYDITVPSSASFTLYESTRQFNADPLTETDMGPEGMKFIEASKSPTGKALLLVSYEISGTVAVYELTDSGTLQMTLIARYWSSGTENVQLEGGTEIADYDYVSKKMFVTNGNTKVVDVVDLSTLTSAGSVTVITQKTSIDFSAYSSGSLTSVAVHPEGKCIAVAVPDSTTGTKGKVLFYNTDGTFIKSVEVGYLPDMVAFTPDGKKLVVANEGEPETVYGDGDFSTSGTVDPEGSVSVITLVP